MPRGWPGARGGDPRPRPDEAVLVHSGLSGLEFRACAARRPRSRSHAMKPDIHPDYQPVVFQDISTDFAFLTRSTMTSKETIKWEDGNEYPLIKVEISSASHPFYTGKQKVLDSGGRIDKFKCRYAAGAKKS